MFCCQQVECSLSDVDVGFDVYDGDLGGGGEDGVGEDGGDEYVEVGFVDIGFDGCVGEVGFEFGDGVVQVGLVLGGDEDGDGEDGGGVEEFGGCGDFIVGGVSIICYIIR